MLEWHVVSLIKVPNIYIYQHSQQFALKYEKRAIWGEDVKINSLRNPERVTCGVRFKKNVLFQTIFFFIFKIPYMCVTYVSVLDTNFMCVYLLRCQMPQSILGHFVNPYVNLVLIYYYITYLALAVPVALWGHEIHKKHLGRVNFSSI